MSDFFVTILIIIDIIMIFTEETVNQSQLDELDERLFKYEGIIRLDKNDLCHVLSGKDCKLITACQEDEKPTEFMQKFIAHLESKPGIDQWKCLMLYFGQPQQAQFNMTDFGMIQDFLEQFSGNEIDVIWGIHHNPDEVGLTAVAAYR